MVEILKQIFIEHGYNIQDFEEDFIALMENKEYFVITQYNEEEIKNFFSIQKTVQLIESYNQLKNDYPDLKKNSSLIICHKSANIEAFKKENQSIIFRIEEDEYYFRKYLIIYSEESLQIFTFDKNYGSQINNILQKPECLQYYQNNFYYDEGYFLAMQLMVKLPFLKYNSIEGGYKTVEQELVEAILHKQLHKFHEDYRLYDKENETEESRDCFSELEKAFLSLEEDGELITTLFRSFKGV